VIPPASAPRMKSARLTSISGPTERWNRPVGPLGQPIPRIQGARARSIPMWQAAADR
jgi:hypothetical protein